MIKESNLEKTIKNRQIGLDYLRVLLMLMIFNFHAQGHGKICGGIIDAFMDNGAIAMEGFFLLSGYCLMLQYQHKKWNSGSDIRKFYGKRILRLLPLYWIVWLLKRLIIIKEFSVRDILVIPFEILGITSFFDGALFGSQGDWFVSCMLFSYFCFPLLQLIIDNLEQHTVRSIGLILYFVCALAPMTASYCGFSDTYANPFYRMIEFCIGMMLAKSFENAAISTKKSIFYSIMIFVWLVGVIGYLQLKGIGGYGKYEFITIPVWAIMIVLLTTAGESERICHRVIFHLSKVSYAFYLMQFFGFTIAEVIVNAMNCNMEPLLYGVMIRMVSFLICLGGAECLTLLDGFIYKMIKQGIVK